ncbi:MAG: outer-membrane lipoprotein carrier protein LolA [Acidobacteriia bacterium]|nr:outer-membrane lipoprotein carrier protein LolA [Terriglobia bacterium]
MRPNPAILILALSIILLGSFPWLGWAQKEDPQVEHILAELDKAAADFQTLQAKIKNTTYTKVVDDTSIENGRLWFQHERRGNKIKLEFKDPARREILIADGRVSIYYPKIKKIDEFALGSEGLQNKAELGLLAGVGSSGDTLRKTYSIRYLGEEKIEGKKTVKLVLTPRDAKAKSFFSTQEVWLDAVSWLPVRQKMIEPSGDSLTIDFDDVEKNKRISDKTFKIKR